jgi:hypothetical protein
MKRLLLAALLALTLARTAAAACPFQTITFTIQPANLTATACISTTDANLLNTALASSLIAAGNPSPTSLQEWTEAATIMSNALDAYGLSYLQGQATATAIAGVTFTGAH